MESQMLESLLIAIIVGLITFFSRRIWQMLSGLGLRLSDELPRISGTWETSYHEPDEIGRQVEATESAQLHQIGRFVWGNIRPTSKPHIRFKLRGEIRRNTFVGAYKRIGSQGATGTGAFELIIQGNDVRMEGHCIWHDYDTHSIENSSYRWSRKDAQA